VIPSSYCFAEERNNDGTQTAPVQLFYDFCLDDHVPDDHLLRRIDRFIDLEKVRTELRPFYSSIGRPSIDPELMMRC
jgi:transposase